MVSKSKSAIASNYHVLKVFMIVNGLIARLTWFMRQFNYKNCDNLKVSYWSVILIIMMLSEILQNGRHFVRPHIIATLARKLVWIIITFDAAKTENERKLEGNREKLRCLMILHYLQMRKSVAVMTWPTLTLWIFNVGCWDKLNI